MSKLISRSLNASILVSLLAMVGCSSSGGGDSAPGSSAVVSYSGVSLPSAIDAANAESVTTAAGEAVQHGANASSSRVLGIEIDSSPGILDTFSARLASAMASADSPNLPAGFTMDGSCGGRVSIPDDQLDAFRSRSGPVSFTMFYTDYCDASVGAQYTINGEAIFSYVDIADLSQGFSIDYNGVTLNDGSQTVTVNMTVDCSSTGCTVVSDYLGNDGNIYRVADISLIGNETTGFTGTATFYHPDHGSVSITASSVTFGGCGSFPDGGSVSTNGTAGSSAQIEFGGDCTYAISFDDGAGNTGVIDGSFI